MRRFTSFRIGFLSGLSVITLMLSMLAFTGTASAHTASAQTSSGGCFGGGGCCQEGQFSSCTCQFGEGGFSNNFGLFGGNFRDMGRGRFPRFQQPFFQPFFQQQNCFFSVQVSHHHHHHHHKKKHH